MVDPRINTIFRGPNEQPRSRTRTSNLARAAGNRLGRTTTGVLGGARTGNQAGTTPLGVLGGGAVGARTGRPGVANAMKDAVDAIKQNQLISNERPSVPSTPTPTGGPSGGSSGGSAGTGLTHIGVADTLAPDPNSLFTDLINTARANMGSGYDDALERTRAAYAAASEGRNKTLASQVEGLADNLANLDLQFAGSDLEQDWQATNRGLQESADLALANDVAYLEKMRAAEQGLYETLLQQLAMGQLMPMMGGGSGGGGGRGRRRGFSRGGGSGGDLTTTMTEDTDQNMDFLFPGFIENLPGSGLSPAQQEDARRLFRLGGQDTVSGGTKTQEEIANLLSPVVLGENVRRNAATTLAKRVAERARQSRAQSLGPVLDYFDSYGPGFNPTIVKQEHDVRTRTKDKYPTPRTRPRPTTASTPARRQTSWRDLFNAR